MARRARAINKGAVDNRAEVRDDVHMEKARKALLTLFDTKGPSNEAFTLDVPFMAPLKYKDGSYKNKQAPQTDYMFTGAYFGSKEGLIFNFTPVDAEEFAHMEVKMSDLSTPFPTATSAFVELLSDAINTVEAAPIMVDGDMTANLKTLVGTYLWAQIEEIKNFEIQKERKKKDADLAFYANSSTYGIF